MAVDGHEDGVVGGWEGADEGWRSGQGIDVGIWGCEGLHGLQDGGVDCGETLDNIEEGAVAGEGGVVGANIGDELVDAKR